MSHLQRSYLASLLTRKHPLHDPEKLNSSIRSANVTLNPHQVDAAIFAFNSPLSRGAILADEVGLGKTIETGLIINQLWVEGRNKILILVPASLRTQWMEELQDRFGLESTLIDGPKLNKLINEFAESGTFNPFEFGGIFIASHHFGAAEKYKAYVKNTKWDLVVIDEAHRMRNVYRKGNKVAKRLRDHIEGRPKVLLTATPLQNNLMELYGLVSFIDSKILGTDYSYKVLYQKRSNANGNLEDLRQRLMGTINSETGETEGGVLTRTLRMQVRDIVQFTNRHCITEDFEPENVEIALYNGISEYLARPFLASTRATQRNMMELVYRKILASSSFAIAGTLENVAQGLAKQLQQDFKVSLSDLQSTCDRIHASVNSKRKVEIEALQIAKAEPKKVEEPQQLQIALDDLELSEDKLAEEAGEVIFDQEAEQTDDLGEDEDSKEAKCDDTEEVHKEREIDHVFTEEEVQEEYSYVLSYLFLARSIRKNEKGQALLKALDRVFEVNQKRGWPDKAVIFTESRRTQDYLEKLLMQNGFGDGIVLFNGSNASKRAQQTYMEWCTHFPKEAEQNSKAVNQRRALVWKFKQPESKILITTEAGAEGLNLQFANVIINFDLPWNPQRLEQRIGRCHRYGQQHDVLVVNFLNQSNYADRRVYELLQEKIRLFGNLFNFSDKILGTEVQTDDGYEVREIALGSLDSGVGFEMKILEILRKFRTEKEIKAEFDKLQKQLQNEIAEKLEHAKAKVIQHFDEEVRQKLRLRDANVTDALTRYDRHIKAYATCLLGGALKEIAEGRFTIETKKWKDAPKLSETCFSAIYGIGTVPIEEQDSGVIPLSTRAEILKGALQQDRVRNDLTAKVELKPLNAIGRRSVEQLGGTEGQIVVHRLRCEHQSVIGNENRELFEEFVYSGIVKTGDGWKILGNRKLLEQLLDPSLMEWQGAVEETARIRDDLADQLLRDLDQAKQSVIDKNEEFVDRQRALLQQYAQDTLLKIKREMEEKDEEIKTLERQLKISRTMGAHERRELRDEIDKKQKDYFKVQKKYFEAQEQAFADRDTELRTLKSKLELTITEEKLLTLHFRIS
ncbi:hypothetical protein FJZ27_02870 [Candidatus Peribacteria bacterium]|nr:hypothetical protein [Candidatus Peribacteria bacterium]